MAGSESKYFVLFFLSKIVLLLKGEKMIYCFLHRNMINARYL